MAYRSVAMRYSTAAACYGMPEGGGSGAVRAVVSRMEALLERRRAVGSLRGLEDATTLAAAAAVTPRDFFSNDYLGLAHSRELHDAITKETARASEEALMAGRPVTGSR